MKFLLFLIPFSLASAEVTPNVKGVEALNGGQPGKPGCESDSPTKSYDGKWDPSWDEKLKAAFEANAKDILEQGLTDNAQKDLELIFPGYLKAEKGCQQKAHLLILKAISFAESSHNQNDGMKETGNLAGTTSVGLFALSVHDKENYKSCKFNSDAEIKKNVDTTFECATEIYRGMFLGRKQQAHQNREHRLNISGKGKYWSVLDPYYQLEKMDKNPKNGVNDGYDRYSKFLADPKNKIEGCELPVNPKIDSNKEGFQLPHKSKAMPVIKD